MTIEEDEQALNLLRQQYKKREQNARFNYLENQSVALQQRVSSLLKNLHFNPKISSRKNSNFSYLEIPPCFL